MRVFRSVLRIILIFCIMTWIIGFMMGNNPEKPVYWQAASMAVWGIAGSTGILILTLPFGIRLPPPKPRKLKKRASDNYGRGVKGVSRMESTSTGQCLDCGRPVVPGSNYCRYHTDLRNDESSRGRL